MHLRCEVHSKPGINTFCWIETSKEGERGGHHEMRHHEMTLWAKQMVSQGKIKQERQNDSLIYSQKGKRQNTHYPMSFGTTTHPQRNKKPHAPHQTSMSRSISHLHLKPGALPCAHCMLHQIHHPPSRHIPRHLFVSAEDHWTSSPCLRRG